MKAIKEWYKYFSFPIYRLSYLAIYLAIQMESNFLPFFSNYYLEVQNGTQDHTETQTLIIISLVSCKVERTRVEVLKVSAFSYASMVVALEVCIRSDGQCVSH